jgi:hypothetical protein
MMMFLMGHHYERIYGDDHLTHKDEPRLGRSLAYV